MSDLASILMLAVDVYAVLGVVFAVAFVLVGAAKVDPVVASSPRRVRVLLLFGAAAVWPALLLRWITAKGDAS